MIVTIVHISVHTKDIEAFIEASTLNHKASIQEEGNRRFDLIQNSEDPSQFVLYEAYDSAEQAVAHKETAHYKTWRDSVADMMAKPRKGVSYNGLAPTF